MDHVLSDVDSRKCAAESIRTGRAILFQVRTLLRQPSPANAEESGKLLSDAAEHFRSALTQLQAHRDISLKAELEQLRVEVDVLAKTLSETDRLLTSWTRRLGVRANGYTERGTSAPLILVKKLSVTG